MKNVILIILIGVFLSSCKKDKLISLDVSIITTTPSNISDTVATAGGDITSDGGNEITQRGVCWNTTGNPTTSNSKTTDGTGIGSFTSHLSGLTPDVNYYIRAYAVNADSTFYGNQLSFTTTICPSTMTDIDGNVYDVVQIGDQCWMKENLKTSHYNNGTAIITGLSDPDWPFNNSGAYSIYEDNPSYNTTYGKLYNWFAVNTHKLAPVGWHVPSDSEYQVILNYLGGSTVAAGPMKATTLWDSPNTGATNSSGFTALPAGSRQGSGVYSELGSTVFFWTSSLSPYPGYSYLYETHSDTRIMGQISMEKHEGCSVRCVRN